MASEGTSTSSDKDRMEATQTAVNILAQGKRNMVCGEVPTAVNQFQEACKLLSKAYGETAKECADAYFCYGQALLDLARMENGVLGNALQGVPETDDEKEADQKDEQFEKVEMEVQEREKLRQEVYDAMGEKETEKADRQKKEKESDKKTGETMEVAMDTDGKEDDKDLKDGEKKEDEKDEKEIKDEKDDKTKKDKDINLKDEDKKEDEKEIKGEKDDKKKKDEDINLKDEDKKEDEKNEKEIKHEKDDKMKKDKDINLKDEDKKEDEKEIKGEKDDKTKKDEDINLKDEDKKEDEKDEKEIKHGKDDKMKKDKDINDEDKKSDKPEKREDDVIMEEEGGEKKEDDIKSVEGKKDETEKKEDIAQMEKKDSKKKKDNEEKMEKKDGKKEDDEDVEMKDEKDEEEEEEEKEKDSVDGEEGEEGTEEEGEEGTEEEGEVAEGEAEAVEGEETAENTSQDGSQDGENPDDVSNLQLAWEMLELAKLIYNKDDSKEAKLRTAESHLKLGEVSLETEQYEEAVKDLNMCLDIQKAHLEADNRLLAETYYQLGLAYCFNKQFQESVDSYKAAIKVIEDRIAAASKILDAATKEEKESKDFDSPVYKANKEVDDLREILPDIKAKIEDCEDERKNMDDLRDLAKQAMGGLTSGSTTEKAPPVEASSSKEEVKTMDISHLIKRKRKSGDDVDDEKVKKARPDDAGDGDGDKTNGHAEEVKAVEEDAPKEAMDTKS